MGNVTYIQIQPYMSVEAKVYTEATLCSTKIFESSSRGKIKMIFLEGSLPELFLPEAVVKKKCRKSAEIFFLHFRLILHL